MTVTAKHAFEILVRENADMLRAFVFSLVRDSNLADELFQETFLTAWRKLETYDSTRPFGAWLRGIAAMHAMAKKRKVAASKVHYFDDATLDLLEIRFAKMSKTRGDTWEEKIDALNQCLDALPKPAQDVISLYYHKNCTCKEVAVKLGLGLELIKKRLQRTRQLLFDCISTKLARAGVGGLS